jgi:hypothetical protein
MIGIVARQRTQCARVLLDLQATGTVRLEISLVVREEMTTIADEAAIRRRRCFY